MLSRALLSVAKNCQIAVVRGIDGYSMLGKSAVAVEKSKLWWQKHIVYGQNLEVNTRKTLLASQVQGTEKIEFGVVLLLLLLLLLLLFSLSFYLTLKRRSWITS